MERYSRQMLLSPIGSSGQSYLGASRVLVVGCGGIGSTVISYLGGAGVGMILCDHDVVEVTNLHRQLIHDTAAASARMNKAMSAQKRILEQNRTCM
jgi:molybdopterin/thiamine biosynthesis adenylyltransferase